MGMGMISNFLNYRSDTIITEHNQSMFHTNLIFMLQDIPICKNSFQGDVVQHWPLPPLPPLPQYMHTTKGYFTSPKFYQLICYK